ncbi:MAG: sigma-E processing peptidase SpoIIGA [Clostridia bacterium]|nr:sigma-E processing peptidase SpoIIGA [Clostridia bacterium]
METVLYADVLFLIDFSMDYLSLYAASRLLSMRTSLWRTVLAAALGGIYGIFSVLAGLGGLPGALCAVVVSGLLSLIAFGKSGGYRALIRASVTVWGCGALLGGVLTAFSSLFGTALMQGGGDILCAGIAVFFALLRFSRRKLAHGTAEIMLTHGERAWQGSALIDSGNLLTDPIGGYAVILLRASDARSLLGEETDTLYKGNITETGTGVRVVPMRTADGTRLLYGFLCRDVRIRRGNREQIRTAVVCVDHATSEGGYGGCAALLPASLIL